MGQLPDPRQGHVQPVVRRHRGQAGRPAIRQVVLFDEAVTLHFI